MIRIKLDFDRFTRMMIFVCNFHEWSLKQGWTPEHLIHSNVNGRPLEHEQLARYICNIPEYAEVYSFEVTQAGPFKMLAVSAKYTEGDEHYSVIKRIDRIAIECENDTDAVMLKLVMNDFHHT